MEDNKFMFDLFKFVTEIPNIETSNNDNYAGYDDPSTQGQDPVEESNGLKYKLLTATLCSCVLAYADYNNQKNPDNPHENLRKCMIFCDKLMSENLISQSDSEVIMNQIKSSYPLQRPSLIKRFVSKYSMMFKRHIAEFIDDDTKNINEQYDGKVDKVMMQGIQKALTLCGSNSTGFAKFLGIENVEHEAIYDK
jgi:hypothetical protein